MPRTILANARLILPDAVRHGAITIRDGRIEAIDSAPPDAPLAANAVDCGGDFLAPGLVELHTDNLERHIQPRPRVDWPHDAAILAHDCELAGAGITTVFDALRIGSIPAQGADYAAYARDLASRIIALRDAGLLRISHRLHLRAELCSETLLDELAGFGAQDHVGILSVMDHTPGQRQYRDIARLADYVQGKTGMSDDRFAAYVGELRDMRARLGPAHLAAAVAWAARHGAVLASHDDTTAAQVADSAELGTTLAEFPTTADAARACRDHGITVMAGAPNLIRGGSHAGNVAVADLARAGLVDVLSSDYVPAGLLLGAWRLAAIWDDLPRALATVTANPARAAGLTDRGRLATGLRADLIRIAAPDPALPQTPRVVATWVRGRRVA
ncbi:alpha-D-ribose 1-methylphosphonate 5-triphosphate diphosphatase [Paracoccus jiaweipingae]|uniref:alpha-D-ribose 1-methylphosphonate 5-triphosphate diphosphatase n=1 Tax=unclassified Paracoccus (in: a-proteobacteria) TaxID=2688777 RepID=UPI0037A0FB49